MKIMMYYNFFQQILTLRKEQFNQIKKLQHVILNRLKLNLLVHQSHNLYFEQRKHI